MITTINMFFGLMKESYFSFAAEVGSVAAVLSLKMINRLYFLGTLKKISLRKNYLKK